MLKIRDTTAILTFLLISINAILTLNSVIPEMGFAMLYATSIILCIMQLIYISSHIREDMYKISSTEKIYYSAMCVLGLLITIGFTSILYGVMVLIGTAVEGVVRVRTLHKSVKYKKEHLRSLL